MHSRRWSSCLLLAALVHPACTGGSDDAPTWVVRDSAGITIVESSRPAWAEGEAWRLSEEPILDVGQVEGDDAYLLDRVQDVIRLEDGGVAVANEGDETVRRYDAEGHFLWKAGGSGSGPGEFRQLWRLGIVADGILAAPSRPDLGSSYVFDDRGALVRTVPRSPLLFQFHDVFADGSLLFLEPPSEPIGGGERWTDSTTILRHAFDGASPDTITRAPFVSFAMNDEGRGDRIVFGPVITWAVGGDRFHADFPEDYSIETYHPDGSLLRIVRRAWTPEPITAAEVDAYRQDYINGATTPSARERRVREIAGRTFAETRPAHGWMIADRTGGLWVTRLANSPDITSTFRPSDRPMT